MKPQQQPATSSDIASLFSRFGAMSQPGNYQEVVRQDAARNAALRWPLLAEVQGLSANPAAPGSE